MTGFRCAPALLLGLAVRASRAQSPGALPPESASTNIADRGEDTVLGPYFGQVNAGVYRGPRPNKKILDALQKKGIRTVINLQGPILRWAAEKTEVEARGMFYIGETISALPVWQVDELKMRRLLAIMADPAYQPVYVHCLLGNDRTGFVIGLYRVLYEHWTHDEAFAEMKKYRYHHRRYAIFTRYFEHFTGFDP